MKMPTEVCWYLSVLNLGAIKKYQNYLPNTKNLSEINTSVRSRFIFLYAFFSFFFFLCGITTQTEQLPLQLLKNKDCFCKSVYEMVISL